MAKLVKTRVDLSVGKSIVLNGQKLGGVLDFNLNYNITGDLRTVITLKLAIKRNSLKIKRGKGGHQLVSFESAGFKQL